MTEKLTPLSPESALAIASSVGLPLVPDRAALIAGVLHHIRATISKLDELPIEMACPPACEFDAAGEHKPC